MPNLVQEAYTPIALTASALVKTGPGIIDQIVIGSGTAVTIKLWDSTSASGTVILETTAAITPVFVINVQAAFANGLFITIGGTTPTLTVMYQ